MYANLSDEELKLLGEYHLSKVEIALAKWSGMPTSPLFAPEYADHFLDCLDGFMGIITELTKRTDSVDPAKK